MRLAPLLACLPVATSLYNVGAEERLVPWIRENGGFISDSVGIGAAHGGRGIVALEDIKAGDRIFDIPAIVHLKPPEQLEAHRLPRILRDRVGRDAAWAAHVAREVRRVKEEQPLKATKSILGDGGSKKGFHDLFWVAIESHLVLLTDDPVYWAPEEQEAVGHEVAPLLAAERHLHEGRYENVAKFFREECTKKLEIPMAECQEIFGNIGKDEFVRTSGLRKSRTFVDEDMGTYVPYAHLLNHNPIGLNNAMYELDVDGPLKVWAGRDIAKGDDVTINYENSDNHHLLMHYGFTQTPSTEPSYYFYIPRGKPDGHPDVMAKGVVLSTPLFEHAAHGKEGPWWGVSKQLATIFHVNTDGFRNLVEFFRARFEEDQALLPYITQLRYNRADNPTSRTWWADEAKRDTDDSTLPEVIGGRRASDAIRVQMCHYMCVLMYSEALSLHHNETDPADACPIVKQLMKEIKTVHSYDYYGSASEL